MDGLSLQPLSTFWQVWHWQEEFDTLSSQVSFCILSNRAMMLDFWHKQQRENKRDGGKFVFIIHLYIQNTGFGVDAKQEHYSCHILCLESGLSGSQSQHHCYTCSRALRGLCPRISHLQTRRLLKVLAQLHNPALPPRLWSSSSLKLCPGYRTPLF